MNLVLLTSFYPPEIRTISTMMRELAHGLAARGHAVTVVTPVPRDNLAEEAKDVTFAPVTDEGSVRVIRIATLGKRTSSYVARGLAELVLPLLYRRALARHVRAADGIIAYIPHFPLAQVGIWAKRRYRARFLLNVQDIFPQNAIDAGILCNRAIIACYEFLEARAYRRADAITTHTTGGAAFLATGKGVPREKLSTVFNWIDVDAYDVPATGEYRARYGTTGMFAVLFAGILGPTQGLDAVLALAERVRDLPDVRFLFVGEGTDKARLEAAVAARRIASVSFHPFVAPERYAALLQDVDVGLMCLAASNTTAVVPGKLTGYMAAGLPVLALLHDASEGHRIVREAQCGVAVRTDDLDGAEAALRAMVRDRDALRAVGARGRAYARSHFARDACIAQIEARITGA